MERLTVLHIAYLDDDKAKGPNINVPKNVIYGNKYANVGLYNLRDSGLAVDIPGDSVFTADKYDTIDSLPAPFNKPDVVVFHGVYFIQYCRISKWLVRNKIPYIVVPRCSMTFAAIRSHALKKKVANVLFFNKFIRNASRIQFLTMNEYIESKKCFRFRDFFILGNGIEMPVNKYEVKKRDEFRIVFMGRYNIYHKGLDVLLDSVCNHKKWFIDNNVVVLLYGSDSDNGLAYLREKTVEEKLDDVVKICGPVFGKDKERALLDADVFIHTSRLEGQPTAVIEAISYGIPVIVTPGTNVADVVEKNNLGFVASLSSDGIYEAIRNAYTSFSDDKVGMISDAEIKFAKANFEWSIIVKDAMKDYLAASREKQC